MSPKNLRSVLSLGLLLLVLSFVSLPAEASPASSGRRAAVAEAGKGSGILSLLQAFFASLRPGDGALNKEGMSIDPDGAPRPNAAPGVDEGMSIDPNGAP
ncbi:MAG TPA: hypothetical protein VL025_18685 [Thermoanaerobaculia bacterium]|nr:hypothetical protein [Thermoanaerobaculia bacterium]